MKEGGQTLWKFVQNESAYVLICSSWAIPRNSGQDKVTPAQAASTWSQMDG